MGLRVAYRWCLRNIPTRLSMIDKSTNSLTASLVWCFFQLVLWNPNCPLHDAPIGDCYISEFPSRSAYFHARNETFPSVDLFIFSSVPPLNAWRKSEVEFWWGSPVSFFDEYLAFPTDMAIRWAIWLHRTVLVSLKWAFLTLIHDLLIKFLKCWKKKKT